MLNIVGLTFAFIGSFISLVTVMTSSYKKEGITHAQISSLGNDFNNQKIASIIGFSLMALGFLLQLISAYENIL